MGDGDGWGRGHGGVKMETTLLEKQLKKVEFIAHSSAFAMRIQSGLPDGRR